MTPSFQDDDYPADPYPGLRPPGSYVHLDGAGHELTPTRGGSGWQVATGAELDEWLRAHGAPPLTERCPVLAYGSNANPSKITWLRQELGLRGPVVVLGATCWDISAVWSAGRRARDGQRPAVLAAAPGAVERHAVWMATPEQRRVLDVCEGRGQRYRLCWLRARVKLDDGTVLPRVLAYTAHPASMGPDTPEHANRAPLLVDGRPVPVSELPQREAARLSGVPAVEDGLDVVEVTGEPERCSAR